MRLVTGLVMLVAIAVLFGAVTARHESTRLIGLLLAAGLVVCDVWMSLDWLTSHGGRW